jgi:hypothetical protein
MGSEAESHLLRQADSKRLEKIEDNFFRIEGKIDKLSEILISMARAEEKLVTLEVNHDKHLGRITALEERMQNLQEFKMTVRVINRAFWIIVSVGATVGAGAYFYGG